ncbi:MAG: hypothetical protein Q9169_000646 [Polycauliona sp. 2 TL-2023]
MNPTSCLLSRLLLLRAPGTSTLLPFLYRTHTIRSTYTRSRRIQCGFHGSAARKVRNVKSNKPTEAIPFEEDVSFQGNSGQIQQVDDWAGDDTWTKSTEDSPNRPLRNSTITASEKAVFERIFKEISDNASKKALEGENLFENSFDDDEALNSDVYSELNAIFDKAISKTDRTIQRTPRPGADKIHPDQISRNFMTALDAFGGASSSKIRRILIARGSEEEQEIQASVVQHSRKIMKKISEANSDTEIWNVLENDVFILIKQQESQKQEIEEQDKPKKRKRAGAISKSDLEAAAAKKKKQSLRVKEKSFHQAEIEAILSSNYGDYCLAAMRNLRRAYPASPYSMNLLPMLKRLGPISHVLAASTDLYNEVLFLLWSQYSDLYGMADLITEMGNQGIESNETTLRILRMVQFARSRAFTRDRPMRLWWGLAPVNAGWTRVHKAAGKVYHEILQARARRAMEGDMAHGRDAEPEVQMEPGRGQETSPEKDLRVQRAIADQATIMHGGLHNSMNPA